MCNFDTPPVNADLSEIQTDSPINNTRWPGILIGYNEDSEKFSVASAETQCGYFVPRFDLVGDYRNFGEVLTQILEGCGQPVMVLIDEVARSEINVIWEANIVLF